MTRFLLVDDKLRNRDRSPSPARLDTKLNRCWFQAAMKGDLDQLKRYLKKDRTLIDKKDSFTGYALIHWSAKKGRLDILTWLHENKAEISIKTNGYTALHLASMQGHQDVINKLIDEYGADNDCRDYAGKKPCFYMNNSSPSEIPCIAQDKTTLDICNHNLQSRTPTSIKKHQSSNEEETKRSKVRRNLSISLSLKKGKKMVEKHLDRSYGQI